MRFAKLYVRTATLFFLVLAGCACQTAQRPAGLLPPGSAPVLRATGQAPTQTAQPPGSQLEDGQSPNLPVGGDQTVGDPVADLIDQAEKEYKTGLAHYYAGNTEEAKQNFDNALNTLLGSKFDIRSDERLQKEFDRVVAGVDQLYPGGTQADSQAAQEDPQQKSEPAPIDETNKLTPAADAGTKAKAEAEVRNTHSDLPLMMTDQVAGYIAYFSGHGRGVFERAYARSGRYQNMILATLKQEGVPQDLIYLALAESGFHPHAVSRAGARGIWQFMAGRGRGYGLYHNLWVDDRQDPEKSTRAAARHLKELYDQFGDWYLAMAAYNSGPGTVQAAVKRTGYADFWELYRRNVLPKETRNYVPIILAATLMAKNPSQYGLDHVAMEKPDDADTVTINYPVDLRLVAECVHVTAPELQDLNPALLRLTTPREGKYALHLPAGTREQYETAIAAIPRDNRLWWRYHTVEAGDTLASLARSYRTTAKSISEVNHLDSAELEAKAQLIIPVAPGKHPQSEAATYARHITRYHVRQGDTVETVADEFGVSAQMLRRWNGIRGDSLQGRKVLALHLPISPSAHESEVASSHTSKAKHPSSKNETASSKPPATKSAEIERLKAEEAKAEQTGAAAKSATKKSETATVVHHKVKSGETLYSIATLYKTTVAALKRDNGNIGVLHPGMILTVQLAR